MTIIMIKIQWVIILAAFINIQMSEVVCQVDFTEYATLDTTATLPCGSSVKNFPPDALLLYWYRGDNPVSSQSIVRFTESTEDVAYPNGDSPDKYEYNTDTRALKVKDIEYDDEMVYICGQLGSSTAFSYIVELIVPVPPSQPSLTIPSFQENTAASFQCRVSAVKPGVGSVMFTVTVNPDFSIQSSASNLSEGSADVTTGAVSVTYSPQISLQRKHNGQQAVCTMVWRNGEKTVASESKTVDVRFTATSITMDQSPSGLVPENTQITFTCLSDEANPTASVTWTVVGAGRSSTTDSTVDDNNYNALRRESGLTLTVDKTLHNKKVKCVVSGNTGVTAEETLKIAYVSPPLTLLLSPATGNPVQAGTSVTLNCSLAANPAPSFSIWTSDGQSEKWVDLDTNKNSITLSIQKQDNKINLFCRADGSLSGYPVTSEFESYTVQFSSTTILMTQSPSGPVSENTEVTFTCVTDEAEPTADVVWRVDGNTRSSDSDSTEEGMYNTQNKRSVLMLTVDKTLNNKKVECHVSGKSAVRDTNTLDVRFPHNVQISQNPSDTVSQGSSLTLTCEATGGNPTQVSSYSWSFEPRYELSNQLSSDTDRELVFDSVQYMQAGLYKCEADNGAGVGSDSKEVLVKFPPVDVSSATQKVIFTKVDAKAVLNCTVRAYPVVTNEHVTVMYGDSILPANRRRVESVDKMDETLIELTFDSVTTDDFGSYEVVLNNGVGDDVTVNLNISEQSEPQPPHSFQNESVSAISITLSWVSGRNGGAPQTFKVYHQKDGGNNWEFSPEIQDPGTGLRGNYTVNGLQQETLYLFRVIATNLYGSSVEKEPFKIRTQDLPTVTGDLTASVSGNDITFTWKSLEGTFTKVEIHKCTSSCSPIFETSDPSTTSATVSVEYSSDAQFRLAFYQGDELVNEEYFAVKVDSPPSGPPVAIIVAVCVVAMILIVVSVVVVLFIRRKNMKGPHESAPLEISDVRIEEVDQAYAQVNKKGKKSKALKSTEGTEYAGVDLSKKKKKKQQRKSNAGEDNATYAEVEKSTKNKKKGKKQAKGDAETMMYANVTNTLDPDTCEYQNVATKEEPQQPVDTGRYVTDEGLTYAAVAFDNTPAKTPKEPVIIGFEDRVVYDAVDFKKMAEKVEGDQ